MFCGLKLFVAGRHGLAAETSQLREGRAKGRVVYTAASRRGARFISRAVDWRRMGLRRTKQEKNKIDVRLCGPFPLSLKGLVFVFGR